MKKNCLIKKNNTGSIPSNTVTFGSDLRAMQRSAVLCVMLTLDLMKDALDTGESHKLIAWSNLFR